MGDGGGRQAARRPVELDVALHPIDRAGQDRAAEQDQQQPVLERDIGRQREEIEADVLAEDRIALAIGHLVKEAQRHVPVRELAAAISSPRRTATPAMAARQGMRGATWSASSLMDVRRTDEDAAGACELAAARA